MDVVSGCVLLFFTAVTVSVLQLWCAAGVNLSGGKTRDGGSIVGASVFYSDSSGPVSPKKKTGSQSSLDKLDQELKVNKHSFILLFKIQDESDIYTEFKSSWSNLSSVFYGS